MASVVLCRRLRGYSVEMAKVWEQEAVLPPEPGPGVDAEAVRPPYYALVGGDEGSSTCK